MLGAKIAHFAIEPGNNMLDTPANTNIKSTSGINEKLDVAIRLDSQPVTTTPIFDSVTSAFSLLFLLLLQKQSLEVQIKMKLYLPC